jgi:hypothetical protein
MRIHVIFLAVLALLVGVSPTQSAELRQEVEFSVQDLVFAASQGFDLVYLKGCEISGEPGKPQLPVKLIQIVLPSGSEVEEVTTASVRSELLSGEFSVFPAQPPRVLSLSGPPGPLVRPQPQVYRQSREYPGELVVYTGTGFLAGCQLANILIYPLQYLPAQKRIRFYSNLGVVIRYSPGSREPVPVSRRTPSARQTYDSIIRKTAFNPQHIGVGLQPQRIAESKLLSGDCEYLIVTDTTLIAAFEPLADWKTQKGVPTTIVTKQWILDHYDGWDAAEKIRDFIKEAYQNWGVAWVLLGGDTDIIPCRKAWAFDCEAGIAPDENDIPCDLYFSDLDGDWDANGNHYYGEVQDSIDLYPDVFVGRASCSSVSQVQAWVNKVLTYEENPPSDYTTKMLFLAEILWSNPYTNSALSKELIEQEFVPPQFDPITKLYEDWGNETWSSTMAALNDGQNIVNHDGHCWYTVMGVGSGSLDQQDMDGLTNHPRNSVLFSIGCWPAAIDYDCIAEHFVNNPNGGGVAFIGNSRYGWGSPGNPEYGYSDRYDQQFHASLFRRNVYQVGAVVADMKSFYAPFSRQENVYRWCQYQINLLGDPEMPVWTDTPQAMLVQHPETLVVGNCSFPVTVRRAADTDPVPAALVCLMKGEEVYLRGMTDQEGRIVFDVSPSAAGEMLVTVTAHNFQHHVDSAAVLSGGGVVLYDGNALDDVGGGNGDGRPNPGETLDMRVTLKNWGTETEDDVYAVLSSENQYVTLVDSVQYFGTMDSGETAVGFGPYSFSIDADCPDQQVIYFHLDITAGSGASWRSTVALTAVTPVLAFRWYTVDDASGGNGNGRPEPGESFALKVRMANEGLQQAGSVTGHLHCGDTYVELADSVDQLGDIEPGSVGKGSFEVHILPECPGTYYPWIQLCTETAEGYSFQDSFVLRIGQAGFADDMEEGAGQWTHGGTDNWWHLTRHRQHSGEYSWYNGLEGSWYFEDGWSSWLESSTFALEPESRLIFWLWYDVTNYGRDGIHVQVVDQSTGIPDTLDFIGTGGALDSALNTGNDWMEYAYDLSYLPPGTNIRIRFSFSSDYNYSHDGEGFYIDNVRVESAPVSWLAGDVTGNQTVDLADVVYLLNYLFKAGSIPNPWERGDINGDLEITVADAVYLLNYLYKGGSAPQ